jgi:molecular chaperone GrpE
MKVKGQKAQQDGQLIEAQNKYLRALADYQNLERRMAGSIEQAKEGARRETLVQFLGVLDDLEKAEVFVQDQGLKMIMDRFKGIFDRAGVEEIEVLGKEYDPYVAEALEMVPVEPEKNNIVVEVVRKGYRLGNDVVRPAHVKVGKLAT